MYQATITTADTGRSSGSCDPATRVTRSLLGYGVIAGPLYVAVSLAQTLTRDGFDLTRHQWSLLCNGALGWIQITNFLVTGLMVGAFAVGLRRALRPGPGGTWAPRLVGAYGAGLVCAGVFRADPALGFPPGTPDGVGTVSWHGILHFVAAGIGFTALIVACFVVARRFSAQRRPGWAAYSRLTGVLFLGGFVAVASGAGSAATNLAFVAAVLVAWTWVSALAVHLYRRTQH
jgi:hypothetical protein